MYPLKSSFGFTAAAAAAEAASTRTQTYTATIRRKPTVVITMPCRCCGRRRLLTDEQYLPKTFIIVVIFLLRRRCSLLLIPFSFSMRQAKFYEYTTYKITNGKLPFSLLHRRNRKRGDEYYKCSFNYFDSSN
jgi:hypothetical protein